MKSLKDLLRKQAEQNPNASYFNLDLLKYQVFINHSILVVILLSFINFERKSALSKWKCKKSEKCCAVTLFHNLKNLTKKTYKSKGYITYIAKRESS